MRIDGRKPEGPDSDWIHLPDPIAEAIQGLASRIGALERSLAGAGAGAGDGDDSDGAGTDPANGGGADNGAEVRPLRPVTARSPAGG